MITRIEQEYYSRVPNLISDLTEEVQKLREAVEKCTGRPLPETAEDKVNEEYQRVTSTRSDDPEVLAVTDVDVFPFKDGVNMGRMKGMASITLNGQLVIRGLRIMDGENGLFVGYPNDPFYRGEDFRTVCCPVTRQLREHIENCVLEKYMAAMEG